MKIFRESAVLSFLASAILIILSGCTGDTSTWDVPTPVSTAGITECARCHSDGANPQGLEVVLGDSTESEAAGKGWLSGMHSNNESGAIGNKTDQHPYNTGVPAYADADYLADPTCNNCHDSEGDGLLFASFYDETGLDYLGRLDRPVTGCGSCHGSGENHFGVGDVEFPRPGPDRCMACHTFMDAGGGMINDTAHSGSYGEGYMIADTHNAEPGIYNVTSNRSNIANIAGYVIRSTEQTGCSDCHDPHSVSKEINLQWVASGHSNITNTAAWAHYNWSEDGVPPSPGDRSSCQRCHTSSGFAAFANATYSGTTYTPPLAWDPDWKPEMLLCWACHTSVSTGELRNQAPIASTLSYNSPAGRTDSVPDINALNICLSCHSGNGSGQKIKDNFTDATVGGNSFGTFNSHYLAAGGVMFRTVGYEFDSRSYEDPSAFRHREVGTPSAPGTGTNGPCVGCHMRSSEGHALHAVTRDGTGVINGISAYSQTCSNCHGGGEALLAGETEHLEAGYHAALDELTAALDSQSIFFRPNIGYPYFFNSDPPPPGPPGWYTAWANLDTVGAAFNLALLDHEPGAFAHNRFYARMLIYDSIDYIDDGAINNSVEATVLSNPAALGFLYGTRP